MAKATAEKPKARSPYVKYGKSPYKFEYPNCKHSRSVYQAVAATNRHDGWRGEVCAVCNVILRNDSEQRRSRLAA